MPLIYVTQVIIYKNLTYSGQGLKMRELAILTRVVILYTYIMLKMQCASHVHVRICKAVENAKISVIGYR